MPVDIGAEATDRPTQIADDYTLINKTGAATAAGTITSIEIHAFTDITGLVIGIFYTTNGDTLKCRSAEAIAGTITAGSKVTKAVSLAVQIGDFIGAFFSGGTIDASSSGGSGVWYAAGNHAVVDDEADYSSFADYVLSLGGYFAVVAVGRSLGFIIG